MDTQLYQSIVQSAPFGYAYQQIITDDAGNAIDYRFIEVNPAFEEILEIKNTKVVGETLTEIVRNDEINVSETVSYFAEVAFTGEPKEAEYYIPTLKKWLKIHAYSPVMGCFVVTFTDVTGIKQSKETIEQKNQLNAILNAMPDSLFVIDKSGKILNVFTSRPDMLVKPIRLIIGASLTDCFPPDEARELIKMHRNCIVNKEIVVHDYSMEIKGEQRFFEARLSPVDDEKLISLVRDRTQRKRLQEAHQEEATFSRFLFDTTSDGLVLFNDEHRVIDANPGFLKMLGYTMEELKQLYTWDIDAIASEEFVRENFDAPREINETFESVHKRKDGSTYHVEVNAKSFNWKGERLIFTSCRDITEKIHASSTIRESEEKYRSITRQLTEMLFLHDLDGTMLEVNETAVTESGYSEDELKRMNVFDLHRPEDNPVGKEVILDMWKKFTVGERRTFEVRHRRKDGTIMPVEIKTGKISIGGREYILALGQNITERKITENKLIESDRLKTAFINNISHEIRTPLNTILGFGQLMIDADLGREQQLKHYELLQQSSDRLMQTITDIMDISMISADSLEARPKRFSLNPFMENLLSKTRKLCENKNIVVSLATSDSLPNATMHCDSELLEKVFGHLISNAVKFTTEGRISIGYDVKDKIIEFFVKDTGRGIDKEKQQLIFEAFRQADPSVTRGHEGIGLGLSIANALVGLMNGQIWLESEINKGSAFYFSLPYEADLAETTEMPEVESSQQQAGDALVLIAEDDDSNYFFLHAVLEDAGISNLHAQNGAEAVEMCKEYPEITMVLMDIKMPVMNGLEATQKIKEFRPDLPVIAITAHAQTGDEQRMLAAGCDAYAAKPVNKATLLELVNKFHEEKRS